MITNATAGTADAENLAAAIDVLRAERTVEVVATSSPEELDDVVAERGDRHLVVVGGDGSLHAVLTALHRRSALRPDNGTDGTVIGLIPLGTGNDFARTQQIPLDPVEAARVVLDGTLAPVDLVVDDSGGVVANSVHVGTGAEASRAGSRWKYRLGSLGIGKANLGRFGYPIGAVQTAVAPAGLHLEVEVDGRVVNPRDRKVLMVAIGNGASVGGGTELTPDADPEDGLVDVMVSRSVGPLAGLAYVLSLLLRRHKQRKDVVTVRGRKVTVRGDEFWASADGEIEGPLRRRAWRLMPAAYAMYVPASHATHRATATATATGADHAGA